MRRSGAILRGLSMSRDQRQTVCPDCNQEIDPELCGCGDRIDHDPWAGHAPVPMGCTCHYPKPDEQADGFLS
jgi:hypothetical protein